MKRFIKYLCLILLLCMSRVYGQAPEIEWQNTIGGSLDEILTSVSTTMDSGFILGGYSSSTNTGDKTEVGSGWEDYWVVKLNSIGGIEWQNTIGGDLRGEAHSKAHLYSQILFT